MSLEAAISRLDYSTRHLKVSIDQERLDKLEPLALSVVTVLFNSFRTNKNPSGELNQIAFGPEGVQAALYAISRNEVVQSLIPAMWDDVVIEGNNALSYPLAALLSAIPLEEARDLLGQERLTGAVEADINQVLPTHPNNADGEGIDGILCPESEKRMYIAMQYGGVVRMYNGALVVKVACGQVAGLTVKPMITKDRVIPPNVWLVNRDEEERKEIKNTNLVGYKAIADGSGMTWIIDRGTGVGGVVSDVLANTAALPDEVPSEITLRGSDLRQQTIPREKLPGALELIFLSS